MILKTAQSSVPPVFYFVDGVFGHILRLSALVFGTTPLCKASDIPKPVTKNTPVHVHQGWKRSHGTHRRNGEKGRHTAGYDTGD
jgi:hypothetical protein